MKNLRKSTTLFGEFVLLFRYRYDLRRYRSEVEAYGTAQVNRSIVLKEIENEETDFYYCYFIDADLSAWY